MVRVMSAAAKAHFAKAEGVSPMMILDVNWPAPVGQKFYGERTFSVLGIPVDGRILSVSSIDHRAGVFGRGSVSSVSVTLSDNDAALLAQLDSSEVARAPVQLFLYDNEALTVADLVTLVKGSVAQPVYNAETRTVSFEIVSELRSEKVGHTPTTDEITFLPEDSDDQPWSIAFGVVEDLLCVQSKEKPKTVLVADVEFDSPTLTVEDADDFPQSTPIKLKVDGEIIAGSFSGNTFTITGRNQDKYTDIISDSRPSGNLDELNPFVLWIDGGEDLDLVGQQFRTTQVPSTNPNSDPELGTVERERFCVAQKGAKCWFDKAWTDNLAGNWIVMAGIEFDVRRFGGGWLASSQLFPGADKWLLKAGQRVVEFENENEQFVACENATNAVLRVSAFRQVQSQVTGLERRQLVPVPNNYYTVNTNNTTLVTGRTVTVINFPIALSERGAGWEDGQVFASVDSTLSSNVADIIQWVLENYTNLTIDAASFAAAKAKVENYPAHCAIEGGPDAWTVCQDIAMQARCALNRAGGVAYLKYLSAAPTGPDDVALTDAVVRDRSLVLEETRKDDLYTVIKGEWYKRRSERFTRAKPRKVEKEANVDEFGARNRTINFWIYHKKSLVRKSVNFYRNRMAYVWRHARVKTFLNATSVEPSDVVRFALSDTIKPNPVDGWALDVQLNSEPWGIALLAWLPVLAGTTAVSSLAYLDDSGDTKPADPGDKITEGAIEVSKVVPQNYNIVQVPERSSQFAKVLVVIQPSSGLATAARYIVALHGDDPTTPTTETGHLIAIDNQVGSTGFAHPVGTWLRVTQSPSGLWLDEQKESEQTVFPVTLTKTGGSQGTDTTPATWTYTVKDGSGNALATGVNPTSSPHLWRRPSIGWMTQATGGTAFMSGTTLILMWINEVAGQEACPTV